MTSKVPEPPAPPRNEVVAWVNDEEISASALSQELQRLRTPIRNVSPSRREQVLQRMIDERLLAQWSADHVVVEAAVDTELQRLEGEVFGGRDGLMRHLDDRDLTVDEFRERLRVELSTTEKLAPTEPPDSITLASMYREVTNRPPTQMLVSGHR